MDDLFFFRLNVEVERARRIRVSVWAFAYEFMSAPLVSDAKFDEECGKINLAVDTGRPDLDAWFRANFQPHTGMWIRSHPELDKIERLYHDVYTGKKR